MKREERNDDVRKFLDLVNDLKFNIGLNSVRIYPPWEGDSGGGHIQETKSNFKR